MNAIRFSEFMDAIGKKLDIKDLLPDDQSRLFLLYDDEIPLRLELDVETGLVRLCADIWDCGGQPSPDLARRLCAANLYWQETDGATLGYDEAEKQICLIYHAPIQAHGAASFTELFESFVFLAQDWREKIKFFLDDAPADAAGDVDALPINAIRI